MKSPKPFKKRMWAMSQLEHLRATAQLQEAKALLFSVSEGHMWHAPDCLLELGEASSCSCRADELTDRVRQFLARQ